MFFLPGGNLPSPGFIICNFVSEKQKKDFVTYNDSAMKKIGRYTDAAAPCNNAVDIINRLKSDACFAEHFFFCRIAPMRARVLGEISRYYGISVHERDFSTLLYECLWSDGTWKKLDTYKGTGSFYSWLATVARREVRSHFAVASRSGQRRETPSSHLMESLSLVLEACPCRHFLEDVFSGYENGADIHEKVFNFMYAFPERLGWSPQDMDLWRRRYLYNEKPVELAAEYGRSRAWVDTRYSRLKAKYDNAVRAWWNAL